MGEAKRRIEMGMMPQGSKFGQEMQIQINIKDSPAKECECGCKFFQNAVTVHVVSALLSPTGQELMATAPVLVCMECKKPLVLNKNLDS